jgi:hypothetical protein
MQRRLTTPMHADRRKLIVVQGLSSAGDGQR